MAVGTVPGQEKLRGVLAGRNFKAGEAVISVPLKLAVRIGLASQTAQVCTLLQCATPVLVQCRLLRRYLNVTYLLLSWLRPTKQSP